jgi:hypothetical protein
MSHVHVYLRAAAQVSLTLTAPDGRTAQFAQKVG